MAKRNLEVNNEKLRRVVTKQQSKIAREEKNVRLKNVDIGGLGETEPLSCEENKAATDKEKVKVILRNLNLSQIEFIHCHRTGNQDKDLIVEFGKQNDRKEVKASGSNLSNIPDLKNIRIKANLTKAEPDEYKRLYDLKGKLNEEKFLLRRQSL